MAFKLEIEHFTGDKEVVSSRSLYSLFNFIKYFKSKDNYPVVIKQMDYCYKSFRSGRESRILVFQSSTKAVFVSVDALDKTAVSHHDYGFAFV